MKFLAWILAFFIAVLGYLYVVGGEELSGPSASYSMSNNNYDGSYTVSYSDSLCGEYGYRFKLIHERDGHSSTSDTRKSNCKRLSDGSIEGYIYPTKAPQLRVFWVAKDGKLSYQGN